MKKVVKHKKKDQHPANILRALIRNDFRRAQRLLFRTKAEELDPQLRIATPNGDYHVSLTLSNDVAKRLHQYEIMTWLMAYKTAFAYTLSSESYEPDCLYTIGVTRHDRAGLWAPVMRDGLRQPVGFGRVEWLPLEALAGESAQFSMADLMPPGTFEVTPEMAAELETVFGATGDFPAVRIKDGLIGLG